MESREGLNMRHVISALVENKVGVLAHISGLFSSRGFNSDSLTVGRTENPDVSRMTIVVDGSATLVEQARKQLSKVIEVVKVIDITGESTIHRELALIKVKAGSTTRSEIIQIVDVFRASIVDVGADSLMIEVTGDEDKIESLCNLLRGYGIKELARTGPIAMPRGLSGPIKVEAEKKGAASKETRENRQK
jgi:acetolactate synthase-1/3 small subunit